MNVVREKWSIVLSVDRSQNIRQYSSNEPLKSGAAGHVESLGESSRGEKVQRAQKT